MWEIGRRMKLQARKFFLSLNLDIIKYIMYDEAILKEVSRCRENERKELILAINKRFLSNLNLRNIVADELFEKVKILPNSNTIGWMTAYGNILNIIVNNKWEQKDMEGKIGNLINDNWNSKINVAPNYDATLPKMDIQIKNNYFKVNTNREISAIYGNNVIYTGKYNNMPNYIIDKMNTNQVDKFKIAAQEIKFMKEFSIRNKNKLAGKSISEISNIMASQHALKKPIFGTIIPIQINSKAKYIGIKTSPYTDKFWKEWYANYNISYKFMRILKLSKDINIREIKLLVEKYGIHAIYTKFRINGLNIDTMEGEYYIYKLYTTNKIGELFETAFYRENLNGSLYIRIRDGITIISKIINTNTKLLNKHNNMSALEKLNDNNYEFTYWNKYNWKIKLENEDNNLI
jgi:hypothetical protein